MKKAAPKSCRVVFSILLRILFLGVLFLPYGCDKTQSQPKRIGILVGIESYITTAEGFISAMAELGYLEGENVTYDIQIAHGDTTKMKEIVTEFVKQNVDLIMTVTHKSAIFAKKAAAAKNIPVVFSIAMSQDKALVESMRKPGGNVTGVRFPVPDMSLKQMEYLLELIPDAEHILLPYKKTCPIASPAVVALRSLAQARGVSLLELAVPDSVSLERELQRIFQEQVPVDAVIELPGYLAQKISAFKSIKEFTREKGIPLAGVDTKLSLADSVFTYHPNPNTMGRLAAELADRIFDGVSAGSIPVVSPENDLRINYGLCKKLGISVPEGMLKIAVDVVR